MKRNQVFRLSITLVLLSTVLQASGERREQGNLVIEDIPEIPARVIDRMFQYQSTRSASFQDWDPSGNGMLMVTRFGETSQIHYLEKPGGARRQITFFPEPVSSATMCPDPEIRGFLFDKDVGGGESYQIFFYSLASGEYRMLTDGESRNGAALWSNKGDRFAYYSTRRNQRDWDIYVSNISQPENSQLILQEGGVWAPIDWSPDDRQLLVIHYVSANESYYYTLDIETGKFSQINPGQDKIAYGFAGWAKDGKGIYITSDQGSEFQHLRYYDLGSQTFTTLTGDIPWDITQADISPKGEQLAFTANEGGIDRLYLLNTKTRNYRKIPAIPIGQVYGLAFHPGGDKLALVINTPRTPGDIYVLQLQNNTLERWTYSEVGGLNTEIFTVPELIHYQTFDEVDGKPREIPAFYYKPQGEGPFPVLIDIHGGPEGQYVPYFSYTRQYYVNELGIALLAPNVRGSNGYGKSYLKLDNGYKREDSVKDIGKLLDWIAEQPDLDSSRVAVSGGSYGGYMALSAMTHYNERLACGIDIVGISNFVTFLENTREYRRDLRRVEYGDERDPAMREFLANISPTTNAYKITKPMFIAQGLNDPRVPASEALQIVEAIRKNQNNVWYLLAKDEGHGFKKKSNRDYYQNAVVLFLEKFLLKQEAPLESGS